MRSSLPNMPAVQLGVGCLDVTEKEIEYVNAALRSGRLSHGPFSVQFEREFARAHERRFAMFCNSGTSALQVAMHALKHLHGFRDGDEVIVPAITFVATANIVLQNGLTPVFVDVDPLYYELDPTQIERHLTSRTRAIIPVHLFGQPCDMDPIMEIARDRNLVVLEDSCETMFARYKGRPTGSWGQAACFSTYIAHLLVTGVGGLALCDDPELAVLMKSLMNHGRDGIYLSIDDDKVQRGSDLFDVVARRFSFEHVGYSYRATELEAALGCAQMERSGDIVAAHQRAAERLTDGLRDLERRGVMQLPAQRPDTEHAFMMYPIMLGEGIQRDEFVNYLEARGIETRPMLPMLNQPVYIQLWGDLSAKYPVAASINARGFYIGCHQRLSDGDIKYMVDVIHECANALV